MSKQAVVSMNNDPMDLERLQLLVEEIRLIAEETEVSLHAAAGILWCQVYPSSIERYARILQTRARIRGEGE